jgi:hypothetical protein
VAAVVDLEAAEEVIGEEEADFQEVVDEVSTLQQLRPFSLGLKTPDEISLFH